MQTSPPPRQPRVGFPSFDEKLENEEEILDAFVASAAKNALDPTLWTELHDAAVRHDRVAELAFAYESVAQGRKLKTTPAAVQAELFYRAATFFGDVLGDEFGATTYLERALGASPAHAQAFERIDAQLTRANEPKKLAEVCVHAAAHQSKAGQLAMLERAAGLFAQAGLEDKSIETYQQLVRLDPSNVGYRQALAKHYLAANRHRDLARMLEQTLGTLADANGAEAKDVREQLVDVFANRLQEPERALPHVEAILEVDKTHAEARRVATRLLESKGLAARAAAALAPGAKTTDERAKLYAIELENTRGPRRRDVLRRIGVLKQDELGDRPGALAAFEQALAIDPADDELRRRYLVLGSELRGPLEVAKAFARAATVAKDAAVKARINAEMGELLLRGGDPKRARSVLASVLATPEVDPHAELVAARTLVTIFEGEKDTKNLLDALARVGERSPVEAERLQANEQVAALATQAGDTERAIAAYRRLVDSPARERALEALEPFYVQHEQWADLAFVLEERARSAGDPIGARELAFRAALVLTTKLKDTASAADAWRRVATTYGAGRDVHAQWVPVLEAERRWGELAEVLAADADLAQDDEKPSIFARLGQVHLTLRDVDAAIEAFRRALAIDPQEPTGRATLEKLLATGDHRLKAAGVLESVYRRAGDTTALLKVLEVRAALSTDAEERLSALEEATRVALAGPRDRAFDLVSRGLREAVEQRADVDRWLDRADEVGQGAPPSRRASVFAKALGDRPVDSPSLLILAKRTGEAHASAGNVGAALGAFRKALSYEPGATDLIARVDELLREQGQPEERIALYRAALERNPEPEKRRYLLHGIGAIERTERSNAAAAIAAYRQAMDDDADDTTAFTALVELYTETEAWDELCAILERRLPRAASPDEARSIRAQLAGIAARHGQSDLAAQHARTLLDDPDLGDAELALVERIAAILDDDELLHALLERRVRQSTDPKVQVESLAKLATLAESAGEREAAVARLRQAAEIARGALDEGEAVVLYERLRAIAPDDRQAIVQLTQLLPARGEWSKLPALYEAWLAQSTDDDERRDLYVNLARIFDESLDDPARGYEAAAAAIELAPADAKILGDAERLAVRAGRTEAFAAAIDRLVGGRDDGDARLSSAERVELRLAKARALSAGGKLGDAARAFRGLLAEATNEAQVAAAFEGFEELLRRTPPSHEKAVDVRWLAAERIQRAAPEDRARVTFAAARMEETELGATKEALALYKQVLAADPEDLEALAAVARLSLAEGDVEGALSALTTRRDASEGEARVAIEVQIAYVLAHRLGRTGEALACVERILEAAPHDSAALELATSLLKDPEAATQAARILERAVDAVEDPAVRIDILKRLLAQRASDETRVDVYGKLFDILDELGSTDEAFTTAMQAAREWPEESALWDRVETIARKLSSPEPVASLYEEVLRGDTPAERLVAIGERAVAFHEEWFEDDERVIGILKRLLAIDPTNVWAFDRLKLIYDARERWDDLFALVDRTAACVDPERRMELLEDAAQIAKDFANHAPRAIGYLEQLLELKPNQPRISAALERLYEKNGYFRELIRLLGDRIETLPHDEAQRERGRIARLWLDELSDSSSAIIVAEDLRAHQREGEDVGVDVVDLLERILAAAEPGDELRPSVAPPPEGARRDSYAPMAAARGLVRQRAAALLKTTYAAPGRERDLARVLEVELEIVKGDDERVRRHRAIATLHAGLGDDAQTAKHLARLVCLEPHVDAHREELTALLTKLGRFDQLADVLEEAAAQATEPTVKATLWMQAGTTSTRELRDEGRAIELFFRVLALPVPDAALLDAARAIDPLLARASRKPERLAVLERLAGLETDDGARLRVFAEAARLARELRENARATRAWDACLALDPSNVEALDGLVAIFDETEDFERLVASLMARARVEGRDADARRADRVRAATIQTEKLEALDDAIATWQGIETTFGPSDEGTRALGSLYRRRELWGPLAELLSDAAARAEDPARKVELLCELGDVERDERDLPGEAVVTYDAALAIDPRAERARAGLHVLLRSEAHRADAVRVLLEAYRAADDWALVLGLTEHRLAVSDVPTQIAILREAASISESRAEDAGAAFALVRRAVLLDPSDAATLDELFRLAAATRNHRSLADALREGVELVAGDRPLARALRFKMGAVLETDLDEADDALEAYAAVAHEDPANVEAARATIAVVRRTRRWDAAARALVETSVATGDVPAELVEVATQSALEADGFDALAREVTNLVATEKVRGVAARDLEATVAEWHRDRRDDADAAEAAYARALVHDRTNAALLEHLANLQRRTRTKPFVETLLRLAEVRDEDLDLLGEAADAALANVGDPALSKAILERLQRAATKRWTSGEATASAAVERATRDLTRLHEDAGDHESIVDLLVKTASLPWPAETSRGLRLQAARVAAEHLRASDRATGIYLGLVDEDPRDGVAASELARIYGAADRKGELLTLKRRLVGATDDREARLERRLEVAALEDALGDAKSAIHTLESNLEESERHAASVAMLEALLTRREDFTALEQLLSTQASLAKAAGDAHLAADLHGRAAGVSETKLGDVPRALAHLRDVVALEQRPEAYDALARLSAASGDHDAAATYLDRLRELSQDDERERVTLRLADALMLAGKKDAARERLEAEVRERAASDDARSRLVGIYREEMAWDRLAESLAAGAAHAPDKASRLARLLEGAELHRTKTGTPDASIPLLEQAAELSPEEASIKLTLADALGKATRYDDARAILRELIEGFGGRRPKERAPVHYQLARLDLAAGDRGRALVELDAATRIDPANASILQALAELARDDGQLERAERSYRALLAVLRRHEADSDDVPITRSEVLFELSRIADRQGEPDRAREILESALETATSNVFEARRLEAIFRRGDDHASLARALEARLARADLRETSSAKEILAAMPDAASVYAELGRLYEHPLGRLEDALTMHLAAIAVEPSSKEAHDAAARLAPALGKAERYEERLRELEALAAAPQDEAALLVRRAGLVDARGDAAGAIALYERAIELGANDRVVLDALDRLYEKSGDHEGQARILGMRLELDGESIDASADALYRLAQLRFHAGDVDGGCDAFERGFAVEADWERAEKLLRDASDRHPTSERIVAIYERLARTKGRERTLVDALVRKAKLPGEALEPIREAVQIADDLEDWPLARAILEAWMDSPDRAIGDRVWVLSRLSALSEKTGDLRKAAELKERAAEIAEPDEARRLLFEVASLASGALDDLALATTILERLHEREPSDREAWLPLLELHRRTGAHEKLSKLLEEVASFIDDLQERSRLRFENVRLGMDKLGLSDERAMQELREIVDEDGSATFAAILLGTILERHGLEDDLVELLEKQLDSAKDRQEADAIVALSQRLGKLLEPRDEARARDVYYVALDWKADARDILLALERLHGAAGESDARADVMERRLAIESDETAEALAVELAEAKRAQGDTEGALAAMAKGFERAPRSTRLRTELEESYRASQDFEKLAELHLTDARARESTSEKVALFRKAAGIFTNETSRPTKAIEALREAVGAAPDDVTLLFELVDALLGAERFEHAESELTAALERFGEAHEARVKLLERRANVRVKLEQNEEALADFDTAMALGATTLRGALAEHLERTSDAEKERGSAVRWRELRLRLADVRVELGEHDAARNVLSDLLKVDGKDRDALRATARVDEIDERWDAASATYRRLVALEEGDAMVDVALKLAETCEKADRLADARGSLERARKAAPDHVGLRETLAALYEKTGALKELAELAIEDARAAGDVGPRFDALLRAGQLYLLHSQDPQSTGQVAIGSAIAILEEAHALRPADLDCTALLSDAYVGGGRVDQGRELLEGTIAGFKGRRSRELSALYHRLARIAEFGGDRDLAIAYLNTAIDMDSQNGAVASELAYFAMESMNWDIAQRALRVVTMLKTPAPLPKALAYQHLGQIAEHQGDAKRALGYYKRALAEDPELESARSLLDALLAQN